MLAPADVPVDELIVALEDGYGTMSELLTRGRLRRRYLVVVAAGPEQARALTVEIRGVETLAALADASVIQRGSAARTEKVLSLRLVVVWEPFSTLDAEGRRRVVTHELTHAALTGSTSGRMPAWLSEGVALYVSGDRRPAPPGADLAALSTPDAIARLTGEEQANAYNASSAAAFTIAERFGTDKLLDLYEAFNDPRLRGRPGPRLVNRALTRARSPSGIVALRSPEPYPDPPCPSSLKSRRSATTWRRTWRGGRSKRSRCSTSAGACRWRRRGAGRRDRGTHGRAARPPRQVPDLGARGRRLPAHAPAHDRHAAARPAGRAAVRARLATARRSRGRVLRPAAVRHRRARSRPRGARGVLRRPARSRAARRRVHGSATCTRWRAARVRRSRRSCSTRSGSPASATSTPTRRCSGRGSTRCGSRTA